MNSDILQVWKVRGDGPYQWEPDDPEEEEFTSAVWFVEVIATVKGGDKMESFEVPFTTFNDAYQFNKLVYQSMEPVEIDLGEFFGADNAVLYREYIN